MKYTEAMLAESTGINQVDRLIHDDTWFAQQKIDGHRCLLHIEDGRIAPVARSGLHLPVKPTVLDAFEPFLDTPTRWVFDGEYLDNTLYVFDLIEAGKIITPNMPAIDRVRALEAFWTQWGPVSRSVALVPAATTSEGKAFLVEKIQAIRGEGVMFKQTTARYIPGKRSSSMLKVKFRNDIDCIVVALGMDGKANMTLGLLDDDGNLVEVGECTALAGDGPRCMPGDVVTVLCHGASKHNRIVQPTLPKRRTDKTPAECSFRQLDDIRINKTVLGKLSNDT